MFFKAKVKEEKQNEKVEGKSSYGKRGVSKEEV